LASRLSAARTVQAVLRAEDLAAALGARQTGLGCPISTHRLR
jgi:hypothetical protein